MNDSFKNAVRGLSRALNALRGQGHGSIGDPNHKPGCPLCSAAELIEQSFYYLTTPAPAQSREEEAQAWAACKAERADASWTTGELATYRGFFELGYTAALRSRQSPQVANLPLDEICNLARNLWMGARSKKDYIEADSRMREEIKDVLAEHAAAPQPSPQGEDADIEDNPTWLKGYKAGLEKFNPDRVELSKACIRMGKWRDLCLKKIDDLRTRLASAQSSAQPSPQGEDDEAKVLNSIADTLDGLGSHEFCKKLRDIAVRLREENRDGLLAKNKTLEAENAQLRARLASAQSTQQGEAFAVWAEEHASHGGAGREFYERLASFCRLASAQSSAQGEEARPVLAEVHAERLRQDAKWGEQNHPVIDLLSALGMENLRDEAKKECDYAAAHNQCTWYDILKEEFYEAFAERTPEAQRAEFIQVAAVAVSIIECIDRAKARAALERKEGE